MAFYSYAYAIEIIILKIIKNECVMSYCYAVSGLIIR